eukprot:IDg1871t1
MYYFSSRSFQNYIAGTFQNSLARLSEIDLAHGEDCDQTNDIANESMSACNESPVVYADSVGDFVIKDRA